MQADRAALKFCLGAELEREGSAGRAVSQGHVSWKCCCPCQQAENPGKIANDPV